MKTITWSLQNEGPQFVLMTHLEAKIGEWKEAIFTQTFTRNSYQRFEKRQANAKLLVQLFKVVYHLKNSLYITYPLS